VVAVLTTAKKDQGNNQTAINNAPSAITLDQSTITENVTVGTGVLVGQLTVTDPDASGNNNLLTLTGSDAESFEIRNGALYFTGSSPDFESKSSYAITVISTDGSLVKRQDFTIQVVNVNEAPNEIALSANTIIENVAVGAGLLVGQLTVTDPDASGNNNLLTLTGSDAESFEIRNGALYFTGSSPDYATKSSYQVTVTSTDGSLVKHQDFTIKVANVDEAPVGTNITLMMQMNTSRSFNAADFGLQDVDGNSLSAVQVTSLPTVGTFRLNGQSVKVNDWVQAGNLGQLTYTPAANATGHLDLQGFCQCRCGHPHQNKLRLRCAHGLCGTGGHLYRCVL